jgi:predicted HTH domain antitoxin
MIRRLTLDLPDDVFSALRRSPDEFVRDMRLAAAVHWYGKGEVSQEKAAEIAGLDRIDFLRALAREQVPVFDTDLTELADELSRGLNGRR